MVSSAAVPGNAHLKLEFDSEETLATGVPRSLGFLLAKTQEGYDYKAYDDAPRIAIAETQQAGFLVDPQTLTVTFTKNDWSGPFGALYERQGQNRCAFATNLDLSKKIVKLAPRRYFAAVGSGQLPFPSLPPAGFTEFNSVHYVCLGRYIYKMENWGTAGNAYFTLVMTHTNASCVFRHLEVYDGYIYAAAGSTATYAYSADGASWVESNRAGNDSLAEQFLVLNGFLHKSRVPNFHSQTTSGINGGAAWSSEDTIGDSSGDIQMMNALVDNIVFCKEEGILNLTAEGEVKEIYPELKNLRDAGNGWHAYVWNNALFYPTLRGQLFALKNGQVYNVTPSLQQEALLFPTFLENTPNPSYAGRIRAMVGTPNYLYAVLEIANLLTPYYRILMLEDTGDGYIWHPYIDVGDYLYDELWITSDSTSGPVLWASQLRHSNGNVYYWILPASPDPIQDTRSRFADGLGDNGRRSILYEPIMDLGTPTILKVWRGIDLRVSGNAGGGGSIILRLYDNNDASTAPSYTYLIPIGSGNEWKSTFFPDNLLSATLRMEFEFLSNSATYTPSLISYRIHATLIPNPMRVFEFSVDVPGSGLANGLTTAKVARAFFRAMRTAGSTNYAVTLTDMFGTSWANLRLAPSSPIETTPIFDAGMWHERWYLKFIQKYESDFVGLNLFTTTSLTTGYANMRKTISTSITVTATRILSENASEDRVKSVVEPYMWGAIDNPLASDAINPGYEYTQEFSIEAELSRTFANHVYGSVTGAVTTVHFQFYIWTSGVGWAAYGSQYDYAIAVATNHVAVDITANIALTASPVQDLALYVWADGTGASIDPNFRWDVTIV